MSSSAARSTLVLVLTACLTSPSLVAGAGPERATARQSPSLTDSLRVEIQLLRAEVESLRGVAEQLAASTGAATDSPLSPGTGAVQTGDQGPTLGQAAESARRLGIRSLFAVVVLVSAMLVVRATGWLIVRLAERRARRRLLLMRMEPIIRTLLWGVAIWIVLRGVFQVDSATLLAAGAAVGIAVGFAAQDIVKNIFGSLVILADSPFQVGDKISVAGTYGEVTAIGTRSTRIITPDDSVVSVPNAQIMDQQVSNSNSGALDCQVVTDLYLPGWVDVSRAKDIAYRAAITSKYVYRRKPVAVLVKDEIHDTFVTHLKVKAYVLDIRFEFAFMSDVTERARAAFRKEGLLPPWHGAKEAVLLDSGGGSPSWASGPTEAPEPR